MGHTPGPWSIAFTFNIVGADGRRGVANTGGYSENRNQEACHEENIANAHLIAASPEMREFIDYQADLIDTLIERLGEAELIDDMDRVEFNKWSHAFQQMVAKAEGA